MQKIDTYLVCNSSLIQKLKNIKHFQLDLGSKLLTDNQQFLPNDVNVQKHVIFFDDVIYKLGNIGSLKIYSCNNISQNEFNLYNIKESFNYKLDDSLSIYDNINTSLKLFFNKLGFTDVNTSPKEEETVNNKIPEYIKPNKPFTEMTLEERILFARNKK